MPLTHIEPQTVLENGELSMPESADSGLVPFQDSRRQPEITFGRCAVTGQFGKVVGIDLGDISIESPDTSRGVSIDPDSGAVRFAYWTPTLFHNTLTLSEQGLQRLLAFTQNAENPIPTIEPVLQYAWQVLYTDGSAYPQFEFNSDGSEKENLSRDIDMSRLAQLSLVPHFDVSLPTYTFVKDTGKFYKGGEEIDTGYEGEVYDHTFETMNARQVSHHFGSTVSGIGRRSISCADTVIIYLLGWKQNGISASDGLAHVIGVSEDGKWRSWEYRQ